MFVALALWAFSLQPSGTYEEAYQLSLNGDHVASDKILNSLKPSPAESTRYAYYRGVNAFAINNKEEAKKWLTYVIDSFETDIPVRYKNTATLMLHDLENWEVEDPYDIARDMRFSSDRLKNLRGDEKTQFVQKEIVRKLDKLIKEMEDKANAAAMAGQSQGKEQGILPIPGQGAPAEDSKIMGGAGKGKVDEKKLRQIAESWGDMPPATRAKVINELTRDLPEKYRPMIEEYFKSLNKMNRK